MTAEEFTENRYGADTVLLYNGEPYKIRMVDLEYGEFEIYPQGNDFTDAEWVSYTHLDLLYTKTEI
jgi:hypothetical protein